MDKQESKILKELELFKEKFIEIQNMTKELSPINEKILETVGDIVKYQPTDEEEQLIGKIELIIKDIVDTMDDYYN
jgi:hypothetical protein